jgi:hypothetical protein
MARCPSDASAPAGEGALPHGEDSATAPTSSGVSATIEGAGRSLAQWLKSWLGTPDRAANAFAAVHIFKDCEDCPDMVRMPARTRAIGADAGDLYAEEVERPQRNLRMCPGFAITRVEITNAQLKAAGISRRVDRACPLPADGHADAPAACVTAQEMEADVDCLSQHFGRSSACHPLRRWSLPRVRALTTIAARTACVAGLPKMVAECWPSNVPATQVLAVDFSETQIKRCSHRIVEDGADDEREPWWRLSARRAFDAAARSPRIGLRIMRTFDLTARNGF